ncbi:MAG: NAD(P)-dependent oxidoreductase [Candidatus Omnitrophota bacterium]
MKVTVFGGSGFLGSHVADVLSDRGHSVLIFDKDTSPYLRGDQKMMVGDVLDARAVSQAVEGADAVYNFIALAELEKANEVPLEAVKVNVLGNVNILEACRKEKVGRFLFSSSIYIYSDKGSFYRSSKQSCELFIENYHKVYGLNYTVLRYGSLYGLRCDERNGIYRMLKQALTEGKISREGDGEEIREYIHVQDAAKLSVDVLGKEYCNRCVIITGNERVKIKDLLLMIKEMLKGRLEIEYVPADNNEHYEITPYVFNPKIATKIYGNEHLDMGQGILNILTEIHKQYVAPAR